MEKEKAVLCVVAGKLSSDSVISAAGSANLNFFTIKLLRAATLMLSLSQAEVFPCNIEYKAKLCQDRANFKEMPVKHLGHSLEHEPWRNSILNFKNAQLIWMTKWGGLYSLNTTHITQGVFREVILVISCCLHNTCKYLFLLEEKRETYKKWVSFPDSLRCLKNCCFKMTRTVTCLYLLFLFRSASWGSSYCHIFRSTMCVQITADPTQRI